MNKITQSGWTVEGLLVIAMLVFSFALTQLQAASDWFGLVKGAVLVVFGCALIGARALIKKYRLDGGDKQ